jgi:hypothetical protein
MRVGSFQFMEGLALKLLWCSSAFTPAAALRSVSQQAINLQRLQRLSQPATSRLASDAQTVFGHLTGANQIPDYDVDPSSTLPSFTAHWFRQPLDHFSKDDSRTWHQRYWINTRHYTPDSNAPVIVLDGGETSGKNRLPFLDTGMPDRSPSIICSLFRPKRHR